MIAVDSVLNAVNFMWTYLQPNLTNQQIVTQSNSLYKGSLTDRYIYYSLVYIAYNTICAYFNTPDINIIYYIGIITTLPPIINKIFSTLLFKIIREKKELTVKLFIAKILSMIIKFYSKIYLQKKIKNFKYTELVDLLSDYKESLEYFYDILRNFIIILILSYIKKCSAKYYYDIIKYIYNYKTGELLDSFRGNDAKEYLINIIENKQWYKFKKTNTYNAMLKVYESSVSEIDIFGVISDEINFVLVKIFSIWTLASLFDSIYYVPLLSSFLILYNKYVKQGRLRDIGVILMVLPICMIYEGYFFVSFMCQCFPKLMFNKFTYKIYRKSYKYFGNKITNIHIPDKTIFLQTIPFTIYMAIIKILNFPATMVMANTILNIIINNTNRRIQLLYGIIICSTYLSNFDIPHVMFNTFITFLIDSIIQTKLDNIDIVELKQYYTEEIKLHIEKGHIYKKICANIVGYILRRNPIDYTLFDELHIDSIRKRKPGAVIVENYMLETNNVKKEQVITKNDNTYNIIEDYY
jgi:hypothetical protein